MSAFDKPTECVGYAAYEASGQFSPFTFTRRACGDDDVVIDIKFAGICHSDIHQARQEWGPATFPMVPGMYDTFIVEASCLQTTEYRMVIAA